MHSTKFRTRRYAKQYNWETNNGIVNNCQDNTSTKLSGEMHRSLIETVKNKTASSAANGETNGATGYDDEMYGNKYGYTITTGTYRNSAQNSAYNSINIAQEFARICRNCGATAKQIFDDSINNEMDKVMIHRYIEKSYIIEKICNNFKNKQRPNNTRNGIICDDIICDDITRANIFGANCRDNARLVFKYMLREIQTHTGEKNTIIMYMTEIVKC